MTKLKSRSEKIIEKLRKEGKVKDVDIDWSSAEKNMEKINAEFRRKNGASMVEARKTFVG